LHFLDEKSRERLNLPDGILALPLEYCRRERSVDGGTIFTELGPLCELRGVLLEDICHNPGNGFLPRLGNRKAAMQSMRGMRGTLKNDLAR